MSRSIDSTLRHGPVPRHQRGFTLMEMVVVIVLSAIVMGFTATLISAPVDVYFAQTRRSELVDSSDLITRNLTSDLRSALPNSVRIRRVSATVAIVEMLVTDDVVTFYRPTGTLGPTAAWTALQREMDFAAADNTWSVFGRIDPFAAGNNYVYPFARYIAINNAGDGVNDAYQLAPARVITPAPVTLTITRDPATYAATREEQLTFDPPFHFRNNPVVPPLPTGRMFLVREPVAYICDAAAAQGPNAMTLRRYSSYVITAAMPADAAAPQLNAVGVQNSVVASNVSACRLSCRGATTAAPCQDALVVEFALTRTTDTGNEVVQIYQQLPVDNSL